MIDAIAPGSRERRLVTAILVLGTVVLFFAAVSMAADAIGFFGDILLTFFLAWLRAFMVRSELTRLTGTVWRRVLTGLRDGRRLSRLPDQVEPAPGEAPSCRNC